jgi:hypothetical protein
MVETLDLLLMNLYEVTSEIPAWCQRDRRVHFGNDLIAISSLFFILIFF